ncbi:hypothetical protein FOFC_13630, partial [Fusarium oxysporum]
VYRRACVEVCLAYPSERAVVAAAGQASHFQAFDRGLHQTKNGNGPRLFSLPPKSFRNCPNRPVMQRVLGQLAPSRYSSLWYLSAVSLSADVDTESGIQCRRRIE